MSSIHISVNGSQVAVGQRRAHPPCSRLVQRWAGMVGHGNPAHIDELLETGVLSSLTTALAATGGVLCCIPLACLARVHLW